MAAILGDEAIDVAGSLPLVATIAALLLLVGAAQFPIGRAAQARLLGAVPPVPRTFRPVDLGVAVIVFVLAQMVATVGYCYWTTGEVEPTAEFLESLGALPLLVITAVGQAIPALGIVLVALTRAGGAAELGVARLTQGWRGPYAVLRYVLAIPSLFGLIALSTVIFELMGLDPPEQDTALLVKEGIAAHPVAITLLVALVIPLLEEILFRGFLLELLVGWIGRWGGVLISSLFFAALHGAEAFLPIFGLALVLAGVKLRTRSLAAVWVIHALHNGAMTVMLQAGVQPT
ncbi:MAG: type II CAAX endopeptidase family protein [Planctomycetota bacterium]